MSLLKQIIFIILLSFKTYGSMSIFPSTSNPTWGQVIIKFEEMCIQIRKLCPNPSGSATPYFLHTSTFISYAKPRGGIYPQDYVFNSWIQKIYEYLDMCGIQTYFDSKDPCAGFNASGNAYPFVDNMNTAKNILCILTPSFKEKIDMGNCYVLEEAEIIKKSEHKIFYLGLSENILTVKPDSFTNLENKYIYKFNKTFFDNGKDSPDINYFLENMCKILMPRSKNLFAQINPELKHLIAKTIDNFIKFKDLAIKRDKKLLLDYAEIMFLKYPELALDAAKKQQPECDAYKNGKKKISSIRKRSRNETDDCEDDNEFARHAVKTTLTRNSHLPCNEQSAFNDKTQTVRIKKRNSY